MGKRKDPLNEEFDEDWILRPVTESTPGEKININDLISMQGNNRFDKVELKRVDFEKWKERKRIYEEILSLREGLLDGNGGFKVMTKKEIKDFEKYFLKLKQRWEWTIKG